MRYLAQSNIWRLEQAQNAKPSSTNGKSQVLGKFRQIFPLTLFPDELVVENLRIVHIINNGFWMKTVNSIMATDIACIVGSVGPFFGHIHIKSLTGGPEILVDNLSRSNVSLARSLIEKIALLSRQGIQFAANNQEEQRAKLHFGNLSA
ncbi:MAG: hypothetical protein Q8P25_03640 [Candidatus Curtissbacteria bacterium]|nr:hypothetical protein [Candidatus Curtissbacteria bacterium]